MGDIGSKSLIVPGQDTPTSMLLWIKSEKQQRISRINGLKQAIEDLQKGKIPEIERSIILLEQELEQLSEREKTTLAAINSIDTQEVK